MNNRQPLIRRPEDWSMILSLAVSAFVLINISLLIGSIAKEKEYLSFYKYSFSGSVYNYEGSGEKKDYKDRKIDEFNAKEVILDYSTNIKEGNASITNLMNMNGRITTETLCVIMAANEGLPFLVEGEEDLKKEGLYIGENIQKYILKKDGKNYINISGIDMPVAGIIKNHMSAGIDDSMYIIWDNCSSTTKEKLKTVICNESWNFQVMLQSRETDITDGWAEVIAMIEEQGFKVFENRPGYKYEDNRFNYFFQFYNKIIQGVVFVFSLFSCFMASTFWARSIRREIAIRRAFGWDLRQLGVHLCVCMVKFSCISFFLALVVEIVYLIASKQLSDGWYTYLAAAFAMQLFTSFLVLAHMMDKIKKISMSELLREE